MVDITLLEVHVDDASVSASVGGLFDSTAESDTPTAEQTGADGQTGTDSADADTELPTRALAAVGALVAVVALAAVLKRFVGGEDPDVEIETPEDDEDRPVGVTVDE